jgi:hypothetical protein
MTEIGRHQIRPIKGAAALARMDDGITPLAVEAGRDLMGKRGPEIETPGEDWPDLVHKSICRRRLASQWGRFDCWRRFI